MANSRVITIAGIGPVLFEKSRKAKRVIISIRRQETVRVAVPFRISLKNGLDLVTVNKKWIQQQLAKIEKDQIRNRPLRNAFSTIDKADAKKSLKDRLAYLAEKYGFSYNKVSVRNQKTRWGSCSHVNNISLNMKLTVLPVELIDYVLLHELVHTRIHNHSKKFWAELDTYTGNAKALAKQLKTDYAGFL
jgi:predicted metal-dependent hydrolase